MEQRFDTIEELNDYEDYLKHKGKNIPLWLEDERARLEKESKINENEFIFSTMAAHNKFMSHEKEKVVRDMTDQLMSTDKNASQPCLLLGKVQCGKTDTFLSIMGLCFDRGIDIAIVMTKGTNTLAKQTIERLKNDFRFFKDNNTYDQKIVVEVEDILALYHSNGIKSSGLLQSRTKKNATIKKFIIVVKKEITNLEYINKLFEMYEPLRSKKVLICDDEADFASRAYYNRRGETSLLRISEEIEKLIKYPTFCRYMQITATPYSLYLQPDGTVLLREGEEASPWLPRYTGLVPIHDKYIGGEQYYERSEDENSMYSCLFQPVTDVCMEALSSRHNWYLKSNLHSRNLNSLNYAIVSYFFATAVRIIQCKKVSNVKYQSSCLIHCEVAKKNHEWQEDIITEVINNIRDAILDKNNVDEHLLDLETSAYESLSKSNELGNKGELIHEKFPTFKQIEDVVREILAEKRYSIKTVNSDEPVALMLNKKGQLELEQTLNIFIGGSILDRGITIDNMLCFFYGRDPKKFQMDTVLQHARMYGARKKEDMACTRFFTTKEIYDVLKSINNIDHMMYDYLKAHRDTLRTDDFTSMVIGYDKRVKATAQNKYTPANTKVLKPHQRILPVGFQTGKPQEIKAAIDKIDSIIASCPNYKKVTNKDPFFLMDYDRVVEIVHLMTSTYRYGEKYGNVDYEWDENEMLTALDHCTFNTDGQVYILYRPDRDMSREREKNRKNNNIPWIDAPDNGVADTKPSREKAVDRPVLILTRQNGNKAQGWQGAPFYWPVLVLPQTMPAGIFTINGNKKTRATKEQTRLAIADNYPKEEILSLPITTDAFLSILAGEQTVETREIKSTTASLYLEKDGNNNFVLAEGVNTKEYYDVYSYNNGTFPYKINTKFKYMYLRCSRDYSGSQAFIKLKTPKIYTLEPAINRQNDVLYTDEGKKHIIDDTRCQWTIIYNLAEVLDKKLTPQDEEALEEYKKGAKKNHPISLAPERVQISFQGRNAPRNALDIRACDISTKVTFQRMIGNPNFAMQYFAKLQAENETKQLPKIRG